MKEGKINCDKDGQGLCGSKSPKIESSWYHIERDFEMFFELILSTSTNTFKCYSKCKPNNQHIVSQMNT